MLDEANEQRSNYGGILLNWRGHKQMFKKCILYDGLEHG